jgi:hypothetical protein
VYSFREDWHQDACANPLIGQYQVRLDAALRNCSHLQDCAVACCHCGIRFVTHPRNAKRQNLRCPFGCREHHRRQRANQRSRRHYQSASAKRKKKLLNGKRSQRGCDTPNAAAADDYALEAPSEQPAATELARSTGEDGCGELGPVLSHEAAESARELIPAEVTGQTLRGKAIAADAGLPLEGFVLKERTLLNSSVLPYGRMVASLIVQRTISREELLTRLRRRMRQHSMGRLSRREYVLHFLNQHPP